MASSPLDWDVELPDRTATTFQSTLRRGVLTVTTEEGGTERFSLPLSVAKTLKAKRESGEIDPGSRAEVLYHVRMLSETQVKARIAKLVDRRDYSVADLLEKLRQDGYSTAVREASVARAVECGLVDDQRYAASLIRTKVASGWGQARISQELMRHGVEASSVKGWPEAFFESKSEDERAYELASTRRIAERNGFEKLVRYLCARGYSTGCAVRAARRVMDEREADLA